LCKAGEMRQENNSPKDISENLLPVRILVRTNYFLTTDAKFDNFCCQFAEKNI